MKKVFLATTLLATIFFVSCDNNSSNKKDDAEVTKDDPLASANKVLQIEAWQSNDNSSFHTILFDGKMFKYIIQDLKMGYARTIASYSGAYTLEKAEDNSVYVSFKRGRIDVMYKLMLATNPAGSNVLTGDLTFIQDKPQEPVSAAPEPVVEPTTPEVVTQSSQQETQTPVSTTGTVNVDKTYFYNDADIATKRKGYLIKGQSVKISDKKGDFIYCIYETDKAKTEGWMLVSDIRNNKSTL